MAALMKIDRLETTVSVNLPVYSFALSTTAVLLAFLVAAVLKAGSVTPPTIFSVTWSALFLSSCLKISICAL